MDGWAAAARSALAGMPPALLELVAVDGGGAARATGAVLAGAVYRDDVSGRES